MASADLKDGVTCSICLNIFKDPVTLNCGHNYCLDCIDCVLDAQEDFGNYWCPECRYTFRIRPNLQRNILLCNIVDVFQSTQHRQDYSKERFPSKDPKHDLSTSYRSPERQKCPIHGKLLDYYCSEDAACICASCWLDGGHQEHQVEKMDEAFEKNLRNVLKKLVTRAAESEERVRRLNRNRKTIQITASNKAKRATALFRGIRIRLEELEETFQNEILRQEEEASLSVLDLIREMEVEREELSRRIRHIEDLCKKTNPLTVLEESNTGDICEDEDQEGDEHRKKLEAPLPNVSYLDVDRISFKLSEAVSQCYTVIEHFRKLQSSFLHKTEVVSGGDTETLSANKVAEGGGMTVVPSIHGNTYRLDIRRDGLFRCSETKLQFLTSSQMCVEYQLESWSNHMTDTLNNGYQIISPLFNIKMHGPSQVSAVYLPHCLSSKDYGTYKSYIKLVRFKNGKMILESPTRLEPSYIVLENPTFSFFGALLEKFWTFITRPFSFNGIVLIYGKAEEKCCLRLYTMIDNQPDIKKIIDERIGDEFHWIDKAPQVESVYVERQYVIQGLSEAEIEPEVLRFRFTCPSRVFPYTEITMNEPSDKIVLRIAEKNSGQIIWSRQLKKEQLEHDGGIRPIREPDSGARLFIQRRHIDLCKRMGLIEPILLSLRQRGVINEEEEEEIRLRRTTMQRNDFLLNIMKSKGAEEEFYKALKENDPWLVGDLTKSMGGMSL
ncbi:uncharacterized protein LOC143923594 isoform X2 [Lithobates pipiens]